MWEIHMLGLTWRELETGHLAPRQLSTLLTRRGLETGFRVPRQSSTLPVGAWG